ncbi:DRMBL-domain-containing protein [Vararia minispora EC-137]|uniref:DRMBL-domain-containing protein n=1 Tax=Vararia minispora EC-137 TaxID=1314806 RepID=A0ACB8QUL1_9AGAM|nr:DRMBL-domain-containing protein [Vararia minispora EC-137]
MVSDRCRQQLQAHVDQCITSPSPKDVSPECDILPQPPATRGANAFSVLMSSHSENEAWKEAAVVENKSFRATKSGRRKAPFYKVMTGMPIAVDAFRYGAIPGITAYFLTHAHSDHYTNLSSNWKAGPIYCSEGTANLIVHMLSVDRKWVHALPMNTPIIVPNTGGVTVTLIEANHCPGSSLFLFEGKQTVNAGDSTFKSAFVGSSRTFRYLHCGDFRASPQHVLHPALKGKRIDTVYLDTTYLNPRYTFPSQSQTISACADLAKKLVTGEHVAFTGGEKGMLHTMEKWFPADAKIETDRATSKASNMLVVVGTYSIGKERIVKAIAQALNTKVYCDSRKAAILRCQQDPDLHTLLTKDPYTAGVHLVPLSVITSDRIKEYTERWKGHWDKAVGFRPTGWTYTPSAGADSSPSVASVIAKQPHRQFGPMHLRPMRNSTATYQLFGVPYSEHSSFFELTCFSLSLDWTRIIATVNVGSEASRVKISAWISRWEAERKRRGGGIVPYRSPEYW